LEQLVNILLLTERKPDKPTTRRAWWHFCWWNACRKRNWWQRLWSFWFGVQQVREGGEQDQETIEDDRETEEELSDELSSLLHKRRTDGRVLLSHVQARFLLQIRTN